MILFLMIGIGNPGAEYSGTRHNAGAMCLSFLLNKTEIYSKNIEDLKVGPEIYTTAICLDYVNNTGDALSREFGKIWKHPSSKLVVFSDDLETPLGKWKCGEGWGAGGHNGLRNISSHFIIPYLRVKIGIGRPKNSKTLISDYVLQKFSMQEKQILLEVFVEIKEKLPFLLQNYKKKTNLN